MSQPVTPRMQPIRVGNVYEGTLERLLQAIRLGQFRPGEKMPPERELAESLGVSRTTLRDALSGLQSAGYVAVARGRYGGHTYATGCRTLHVGPTN
ncbi:FadR/GntR family transcriptional regulator [Ornithinimicrobium sp. INDO-MA30-4]|uniref:FadR/GntR family transcriptional regulator n=1 Tax=Ornithinimicrobium sp. INDO-MA30-4 TaxID=2908651 RepID=UPI001F17F4D0|nr:GntR family transcriptional regulator [Ornithinimicrobium sp. INDO-MA30-4]UJH71273.1 GntR family transcriptional regulator [Ornithinimicrobium sp. INDO-MA30-4]